MALVDFPDRLISMTARKRVGLPNRYGWIIYGWAQYGVDDDNAGVYQVRPTKTKRVHVKMRFCWPINRQTEPQQLNRGKFALAVEAWQALSAEQKAVYNQRAVPLHFFGYHLFLREYMLTN